MNRVDPAGLGRGPLTRWLPVFGQAPARAPHVEPFTVGPGTTPRRFLWQVLSSQPRYTVPGALVSIVEQVCMVLMPVVVGVAIDRALATGEPGELCAWLGVLALVGVVRIAASRLAQRLTVHAAQQAQHRLRGTLSRTVLHPSGPVTAEPDGAVVSLMTNDVLRLAMLGLLIHPVGEVAAICFIAVALFTISGPLGLVVLIGTPVVVWLMGVLSRRFATASRAYQGQLADTVARATDLVTGYRIVKGIRAEAEATARYRSASRQTLTGAVRVADVLGRFLAGSGSVSGLFMVAVAALAGWFAVHDQLTVGGLIAAAGLAQALLPQLQFITGNAVPAAVAASASAARVLDALRTRLPAGPEPVREDDAEPSGTPVVELLLDGHRTVTVTPGALVGVLADGGTAGRVVEAALHPHACAPDRLRLGGVPADRLDTARYRSRVVVSPHHAMLFSGTVADNLATPGIPAARVVAALRAAACEDFLDHSADGLARQTGELGTLFSGGQRQRIALARALATDAPVLVLHDPTTAVDPVTETTIANRLRAARAGRSTILLTSAPALLAVCDHVVDLTGNLEPVR